MHAGDGTAEGPISMLEGDESTFQQQKHDPNKIRKPTVEEWD
jgi:hypothetical protein